MVAPALLVAALAVAPARAADPLDALDAQRFRPAMDSAAFVGVLDPALLAPGPAAGAVVSWADDPLVYRTVAGDQRLVGTLVTTDVWALWTVGRYGRAAIDLPLHAATSDLVPDGPHLGDLRLSGKLRYPLAPDLEVGLAGTLALPTGAADAWLGERGPAGDVKVALGLGRRWRFAGNVGLQLVPRDDGRLSTRGPGWLGAVGLAAPLGDRWGAFGELDATAPSRPDAGPVAAEWRVGGRVRVAGGLMATLAGGAGWLGGVGSPDARVIAGVGWSPPEPPG